MMSLYMLPNGLVYIALMILNLNINKLMLCSLCDLSLLFLPPFLHPFVLSPSFLPHLSLPSLPFPPSLGSEA